MQSLHIYNSLTRQKEEFVSLVKGHVGMYVCGPTVSGESHLGHARPYITFDVVYRYLQHLGYKVRYVRNITDAGHFEEEGRVATDKIAEKAQLEKLEPMELVQKYTNLFHWAMQQFNTLPPSIEPTATGHIVEQNPGWHIECSAMATKYLGPQFDIHGGGMDLLFPHHESEIAQSTICNHQSPVRYWVHNNMITINGRKMGKSYNNVIKLTELFSGTHPLLAKAYHPMTIRFFILQTHYSSTLDFSNEALLAAEKGLKRLWDAVEGFQKLNTQEWGHSAGEDVVLDKKVNQLLDELPLFMNDDFSSAKVLANLFELVPVLNSIKDGITAKSALAVKTLTRMQNELKLWMEDILGLQPLHAADQEKLQGVMELLIDMRKEAKGRRDFMTSDKIRDRLLALGIQLKDEKGGGMSWKID
ncbi:MAG: hypothetical protein EB047_00960 [Chitinophagaceae bacterium]|nr:hypothetical protein [Chitinophagaceae bacterium]